MDMGPTERIIRTLEGKPVDRIPSWTPYLEERTIYDVLGKPRISSERLAKNRGVRFLLDHWGPQLTPLVLTSTENGIRVKGCKAAIQLGFDALWMFYDESFVGLNGTTVAHAAYGLFTMRRPYAATRSPSWAGSEWIIC